MSIVNARKGAYMRATSGGTNRRKSSNYSSKKNNSAKKQKTEYGNRSNAASGNANKNSNKKKKQKTGLEALIDRKDELKNIPAGDGSGRNQYQVEMNKFKSTPGGKKIFKKRFPNPLVKIAKGVGDYVKQGGVIGLLANMLGGGKKAATGFGKDASTMASDIGGALAKAFGLDALQNKNIDIASGKTDDDFNKLVTSTRMRNNLAYGDPLGLNKAPIYRDPIMNMGLPNIDVSMEDAYSNFQPQVVDDKDRRLMEERDQQQLTKDTYRPDNEDTLAIDLTDQYSDTINLSGDPNEVIEDVSETEYDTSGLKRQIMNNPGTTTFGAVPGQNFNVFDPLAYLQENPITEDTIETDIFSQATGGYMSSFPNQNLNTESLSASDNIDDRIMKNLEFEKMAPGMMGYNEGGRVMSTYDKLKAIADNNYGQ